MLHKLGLLLSVSTLLGVAQQKQSTEWVKYYLLRCSSGRQDLQQNVSIMIARSMILKDVEDSCTKSCYHWDVTTPPQWVNKFMEPLLDLWMKWLWKLEGTAGAYRCTCTVQKIPVVLTSHSIHKAQSELHVYVICLCKLNSNQWWKLKAVSSRD